MTKKASKVFLKVIHKICLFHIFNNFIKMIVLNLCLYECFISYIVIYFTGILFISCIEGENKTKPEKVSCKLNEFFDMMKFRSKNSYKELFDNLFSCVK